MLQIGIIGQHEKTTEVLGSGDAKDLEAGGFEEGRLVSVYRIAVAFDSLPSNQVTGEHGLSAARVLRQKRP